MEYREWIELGMTNGWCGPVVCYTHDGMPSSEHEDDAYYEGDDICLHIVRMYENQEHKEQVEEHHSPSMWRKGK